MWCCAERKSAAQREYERLRTALVKKQEEVRSLQEQCDALHTPPPLIEPSALLRPIAHTPLGMPYYEPVIAVPVAEVLGLSEMRPFEEMLDAGAREWYPELGPLLFVSHQWTSYTEPDPSGKQLALLQAALRHVAGGAFKKADRPEEDRRVSVSDRKCTADYFAHLDRLVNCPTGAWVWLDFWSIPQADEARQTRAIRSIPAYLEVADAMVSLTPPTHHKENFEPCDATSYARRGWCRLESRGFLMRRYIVGRYPPFYSFADEDSLGREDVALQESMQAKTFFTQDESIFAGTFSCCQLGHVDRHGALIESKLATRLLSRPSN